jgi:hypothetical protein
MERIVAGARLFFIWSVFLLVLEIVTLFGATAPASRVLDLCAMVFTIVLMLATTVGLRLLIKWQTKRERHERV